MDIEHLTSWRMLLQDEVLASMPSSCLLGLLTDGKLLYDLLRATPDFNALAGLLDVVAMRIAGDAVARALQRELDRRIPARTA